MTDRERLIELIGSQICEEYSPNCDEYEPHTCEKCYANFCKVGDLADAILADGWMRPPCKVGDYVEWDNGVSKHLLQIRGFFYEPKCGLRYEVGEFSPIISHKSIIRIVPREEAEKALEGGAE